MVNYVLKLSAQHHCICNYAYLYQNTVVVICLIKIYLKHLEQVLTVHIQECPRIQLLQVVYISASSSSNNGKYVFP